MVGDLGPIVVERVEGPDAQRLFRELVGRYHYLGYRVPFGAQLRYLVYASTPTRAVVACLQFSSPAWRMASRDAWVGWDDAGRTRNLQLVVNNSRFLILPWVRAQNLASTILSRLAKRIRSDWQAAYGVDPVLLETLVDPTRFDGGCYRAANWIPVGLTTGRGRMDRYSQRLGAAPKRVLLYPLVKDAAARHAGRPQLRCHAREGVKVHRHPRHTKECERSRSGGSSDDEPGVVASLTVSVPSWSGPQARRPRSLPLPAGRNRSTSSLMRRSAASCESRPIQPANISLDIYR